MSLSFYVYQDKPATVAVSTKVNLTDYNLTVEFSEYSNYSNSFSAGTATLVSEGLIKLAFTAAEVNNITSGYYRVKATKKDNSLTFYVINGAVYYVSKTPPTSIGDLIDSDGYLKEELFPAGTGGNVGGGNVSDATSSVKGIILLGGDLGGTATSPTVPGLAAKYTKPGSGIPETDLASSVQTKLNTAGGTVSDATTTTKGVIILAGDLAGTSTAPTVPGLALKAPIASPTFTGTVSGISKSMVGLGNVDNVSDTNKPISTATQTALDAKYVKPGTGIPEGDLASSVQTKLNSGGATVSDATTSSKGIIMLAGDLGGTASSPTVPTLSTKYVKPSSGIPETDLASAVQTKLNSGGATVSDATTTTKGIITLAGDLAGTAASPTVPGLSLKAPIESPTFTGTVSGITRAMVGLNLINNTADSAKPVSGPQQTALDLKANLASPTFTGTVSGITAAMVGLGNVTNTSDANKPVSTAQQTALDLKANLASPTFTGTVSGITKSMVGLANVDNTADTAKPVSTAQQTALDLKAPIASPTFTGTVSGISKAMVGLGNVDNTADTAKPVSTAQQTAIDVKYTKPASGIPETDLTSSVQTKLNSAAGATAYMRVALWDGSNYLVNGVAVTSSNRVSSTYYKFIGGPDPSGLSLGVINGDEWKAA